LTTGIIFDIKKFSIHDGPGIRTTVFFKGCPLNCSWCHNPESQGAEPELMVRETRCIRCGTCVVVCTHGALSWNGDRVIRDPHKCTLCGACVETCFAEAREMVGRLMAVEEVLAEIERDVPFYDQSGGGVTFSGGEPLNQPRFLGSLLAACHEREIHTALDTCGYARWELLDHLRRDVDLFLYDLKLMDDAGHRQFTGVPNGLILENLRRLAAHGHRIIVRVPLIPGVNDQAENLHRLGSFVAGLPGVTRVDLLPYHHTASVKYGRLNRDYDLAALCPPSKEDVARAQRVLEEYGLEVKTGG
jgi:pyruvate formate lyase activating enzyme